MGEISTTDGLQSITIDSNRQQKTSKWDYGRYFLLVLSIVIAIYAVVWNIPEAKTQQVCSAWVVSHPGNAQAILDYLRLNQSGIYNGVISEAFPDLRTTEGNTPISGA
jgi:hypothetical protein